MHAEDRRGRGEPDWIELPRGAPADLGGRARTEGAPRTVVVACPLHPLGGGVRRRVERVGPPVTYRERSR